MDFIVEQLTGPTNPDDFVGRNELIDQYHDLLMDFVRSKPTVKWVHISGVAGTGKSSLLRKFRMMTELELIATGSVEVPISPKLANQFLTDIKQVIDEMAPEWRNFIQKYRKTAINEVMAPPESKGEEITTKKLQAIVSEFFKDLDKIDKAMKTEKQQHGIFLDDLDRFLNYGYTSILSVIPLIAQRMRQDNYNLILVTTSHYTADRYLGLKSGDYTADVLHLPLEQFDFTEAELMIRRRGKLVKSQRELVVQASTRYPFDLALRQLIQSKDLDPTTLTANVITNAFGMTLDEVDLMKDISKSQVNYFNLEDYSRVHKRETFQNLSNALMIIMSQDNYFAFDSYSLWELISHVFKPIDPRTEVILILDRLKYQAEMGQLPSARDLRIVAENFRHIQDNALLFELSGQLSDAAKAALNGSLYQTAWELLELATIGLEKTADYEKIADLQETLAKGFSKVNQHYFAAKSFNTAGEYFKRAGIDWRSVTNYREAGQKYLREAEETDMQTYHYAVRSLLNNSIRAYMNANEKTQAKKVIRTAKELLRDYDYHINYFEIMEVQTE